MHIPENYLSPATCAVMATAMVPVWAHSIRKVKNEIPKEKIPMIGVGAAFSFLGMMFNIPLVGGTTGHAVGGTLIALLFGPEAACLAVSIALLLQAVIFGDGGVLAFGANCFNMAFVLPFAGFYIAKMIEKVIRKDKTESSGQSFSTVSAAVGSYLGLNLAALCAAVEFGIQPLIFKDAAGQALYCPYDLSVSIPAMMIPHLVVAGIVEVIFTVAIYTFVVKTSPGFVVETDSNNEGRATKKIFPVYILISLLIVATPLGLLAEGTAWGEWGADEIAEVVENGQALGYTPEKLATGWALEPIMPDYTLGGMGDVAAYILSAVIGVALLVILFKLLSLIKREKKCEA
ncbi:MAG: cobalt transporter CbiM [Lachnospiraceae bacterium]|nr:cobalt transporter CbiM [Lachnospiraceae bacterium]